MREKSALKRRMRELGFFPSDITDAFNKLELEGMIQLSSGNYIDKTSNYSLTQQGKKWCLHNNEALKEATGKPSARRGKQTWGNPR